MMTRYPVYKGLQMPLTYKGLKGKYIGWGIASLIIGLIAGGITGSVINMYLGGLVTLLLTPGLLFFTLQRQRGGIYNRTRQHGLFIHPPNLPKSYVREKNI